MAVNAQNKLTTSWVEVTNADVTDITFQNIGPDDIYVAVTVGSTAPSSTDSMFLYTPGKGEALTPLTTLAPGILGKRVYARAVNHNAIISVSHA